jgi:hypothetical protein
VYVCFFFNLNIIRLVEYVDPGLHVTFRKLEGLRAELKNLKSEKDLDKNSAETPSPGKIVIMERLAVLRKSVFAVENEKVPPRYCFTNVVGRRSLAKP